MMAIFRRSLAEDAVDRYNHTWSVLLLLLLSLATWLLILSPVFQAKTPSVSTNGDQQVPEFIAKCWTPAEFHGAHVDYVNSVCASSFNKIVTGGSNNENDSMITKIYELGPDTIPVVPDQLEDLKPIATSRKPETEPSGDQNKEKNEQVISDTLYFISIKTPLALFLFAILFKIPHIILTLLSGLTSINVHQTIKSVLATQALDQDSRRSLKEELSRAVTKSATWSASFLYLMFKTLMLVAAVISLISVHTLLIPELETLDDEMTQLRNDSSSKVMAMATTSPVGSMSQTEYVTADYYLGRPLMCQFSTRMLQALQRYTIQCVFTDVSSVKSLARSVVSGAAQPSTPTEFSLDMYKCVYLALWYYFVLLALVNAFSALIWTCKLLLASCRHRVCVSTKLPVDLYLLLFMAWENGGQLVVIDLSQHFSAVTKREERDVILQG